MGNCKDFSQEDIVRGDTIQIRGMRKLIAYRVSELPGLDEAAWGSIAYVQKDQKWYTLSPYGRWIEIILPAATTATDPATGTLTITLDVDGAPDSAAEKTFKIAVKVDDEYAQNSTGTMGKDIKWFTAADAGTITISGLLAGYVIIEQDMDDAAIDGYTLTVEGTGRTTLSSSGSAITVKNTYSQDVGDLTVTKTVTGAPESAAEKTFGVTIINEDGAYIKADGTTSVEEVDHSLANEDTLTIEGLPIGSYTVTEIGTGEGGDAQIDGYDLVVTGSDTYEIEKDETTEVELLNAYTETPAAETDGNETAGGGD